MQDWNQPWLGAVCASAQSYRRMIDAVLGQLSDEELHQRPQNGFNSVAVILRHLGGNLASRWTDCLHSDGEKPNRDREAEFSDWNGDRQSLMEYFNQGWEAMMEALLRLDTADPGASLYIRGERPRFQRL